MNYDFLTTTPLFEGIPVSRLAELLNCVGAREKRYQKGEVIFHAGDVTEVIGLVETGSVNVVVNFYWGDSNIFAHVGKGEIFGENYAALPKRELVCDVVAQEECEILFVNMDKLLTTCGDGCDFHHRLIHNLLRISAQKNLDLSTRMLHTAPKSIRERLLSYLSEMAIKAGACHFTIPFSRQQLADYLGVDRSAMSNELSKMQRDGLILYHKNNFTLRYCQK